MISVKHDCESKGKGMSSTMVNVPSMNIGLSWDIPTNHFEFIEKQRGAHISNCLFWILANIEALMKKSQVYRHQS